MVSWGMGHNLERNLKKAQALRERGDLDRALRQLQEWARKHPDTPHYLFEAAMVAFDMQDWSAGLNSLRALLRNLPDTREKVLGACRERFEATPSLPVAEFLIEAALAHDAFVEAAAALDRLDSETLGIYAKKLSMRHQSLVAGGPAADGAVRTSQRLRLLVGRATEDGETVLEAVEALLNDEDDAEAILELLRTPDLAGNRPAALDFAVVRVLAHLGRVAEAAEMAVRTARRDADLRPRIRAAVEDWPASDEEKGRWLQARGDLALLDGDGARAAEEFLAAADADASLRDGLLERLESHALDSQVTGRGELLKLQLRLMVVQKRFEEIPRLSARIQSEGLATAGEVRALLGASKSEGAPSEMLIALAETALRDEDLAAAATHVQEIPDADEAALRRVLRVIDDARADWPAESRFELGALRALVLSRIRDVEAANEALAELWTEHGVDAVPTLWALTRRCLEKIDPRPTLLGAALPIALQSDEDQDWAPILLKTLGVENEAGGDPDVGHTPSFLAHDERTLDFEMEGEDSGAEVEGVLLAALESEPSIALRLRTLLDSLPAGAGAEHRLRYVSALAQLWSGEVDRALPAMALVAMMAEEAQRERIRAQFDHALDSHPDHAGLLAAQADVLGDLGQHREAAALLGRALRADPARADETSKRFENLAGTASEESVGAVWNEYARALFDCGRYEQLSEVCARAVEVLGPADQPTILALQIRTYLTEGRITPALQAVQKNFVAKRLPAETALELLDDAVHSQPTSSIARLLQGQIAAKAGRIDVAIDAYRAAVQLDESLAAPVAEQIETFASDSRITGIQLVHVAQYHRDMGDPNAAAKAYQRALRIDATQAERIHGETRALLDDDDGDLDLLLVAAQAARLSGRTDEAIRTLRRVDELDPGRLESVLAELRHLRESRDGDLSPVEAMVHVLLAHQAHAAAAQIAADAAEDTHFSLERRLPFLEELHRLLPDEARIELGLAFCLAEADRIDEAIAHLDGAGTKKGFDAERAERLVRRLRGARPRDARLALAHHDLLDRLGRVDEALDALPGPAALDPDELSALSDRLLARAERVAQSAEWTHRLADALARQGRVDESIAALERAVDRSEVTADSPLHIELARALAAAGRAEEARRRLQALEGADTPEGRRRSLQLFEQWETERQRQELDALRERHRRRPGDADTLRELAHRLLQAEKPSETLEVLAGENSIPAAERCALRARAYLLLGRADRAEAVLRGAPPSDARCAFLLGICAERLGRTGEAHARFGALLDDPDHADRADRAARRSYDHYVRDVAGEYRAVLTALSSL